MSDGKDEHPDYDGLQADVGLGSDEAKAKLFAALYSELHDVAQRELHRTQGLSLLSPARVLEERLP